MQLKQQILLLILIIISSVTHKILMACMGWLRLAAMMAEQIVEMVMVEDHTSD